ncbi:MAG TPA: ABC transporter permease [Phycisphaerales bacterium]|nr:ABC transporter permease [Phycisphaerales bacterium]HMP38375.1 ABC transporter permease [Phycisphaerales bacterium]
MPVQLLAIARNTFSESIRQPIVLVLLVIATLLIVLSIPFSAFTMQDDQRMFLDIGLSTVFIMGTLLAAFLATNVVNREIENGTALTVISKPVGRVPFLLGKYLGVACAILLTMAYMSLVFVLVERHGTMQTVRTPYHLPVIAFGLGTLLIAVAGGAWCNYFYGMVFGSTVLLSAVPLLLAGYTLSLFFRPDFSSDVVAVAFRGDIWTAIAAMTMAILILTAIAVAASTRLGQVMTVAVTLGMFMLGMLSDWMFGRPAQRLQLEFDRLGGDVSFFSGDSLLYHGSSLLHAIVPNFQYFWLADALTQARPIPPAYMLTLGSYAALQIVVALGIGVILFQRREVG